MCSMHAKPKPHTRSRWIPGAVICFALVVPISAYVLRRPVVSPPNVVPAPAVSRSIAPDVSSTSASPAPVAAQPSVPITPDVLLVSSVRDLERVRLASLLDGDEHTAFRFEGDDDVPFVLLDFERPARVDRIELTTACPPSGRCEGFRARLSDASGTRLTTVDIGRTGARASFDPPAVTTAIRLELVRPEEARWPYVPHMSELRVWGADSAPGAATRVEVLVPTERIARHNMVPVPIGLHMSTCLGNPCGYALALAARLCGLERFDARHREAIEARPSPADVRSFVARSCPAARDDPAFARSCGCPRYIPY